MYYFTRGTFYAARMPPGGGPIVNVVYGDGGGQVPVPPAFNPATRTDLVWWQPRNPEMWQDAARTVTATADGDPVRSVTDASGSGHHWLTDSDKTGMVDLHTYPGRALLQADGWTTKGKVTITTPDYSAYTVAVCFVQSTTYGPDSFLHLEDQACALYAFGWPSDIPTPGLSGWDHTVRVLDTMTAYNGDGLLPGRLNVVIFVSRAGSTDIWVNGTKTSGGQSSTLGASPTGLGIGFSVLDHPSNVSWIEQFALNTAVDDGTARQIDFYLRSGLGAAGSQYPAAFPLVMFDGSIQVDAVQDVGWCALTMNSLAGITRYMYRDGDIWSGTPQLTERWPFLFLPKYDAARAKSVLFLNEVLNDIRVNNADGATAYLNVVDYCEAAKLAWPGLKIILLDCQPDADFGAGPKETARLAVNVDLAADFDVATGDPYTFTPHGGITYADALVRISQIPEVADTSNPTYYAGAFDWQRALHVIVAVHTAAAVALFLP